MSIGWALMGDTSSVPAASQQQGKRCLLGPGAAGEPHSHPVPVPWLGTAGRSSSLTRKEAKPPACRGLGELLETAIALYIGHCYLFWILSRWELPGSFS